MISLHIFHSNWSKCGKMWKNCWYWWFLLKLRNFGGRWRLCEKEFHHGILEITHIEPEHQYCEGEVRWKFLIHELIVKNWDYFSQKKVATLKEFYSEILNDKRLQITLMKRRGGGYYSFKMRALKLVSFPQATIWNRW